VTASSKWFEEAKRLEAKGIAEIPGEKNNPDIMFMAKTMKVWYPSELTAWCGLFVGYCLNKAGISKDLPENILGAKQWRNYGTEVKPSEVAEGDILVFWRGSPKGPYGHVGFYAGETAKAYKVLGGNQGNKVGYSFISKERLLSIRRPAGFKAGPKLPILNTTGVKLSTNEG